MAKQNENIELIDWLTCKTELNEMGFTDDDINTALGKIGYSEGDLTSVEKFENEPYSKPFHCESDWYISTKEIEEYRNHKVWTSTVDIKVRDFRVRSHYQGLKHEALVRKLFETKYPWFNDFTWEIFQVSRETENYELYMKTEFGSLYVPIYAITKHNPSLIEKRMKDYFGQYREGRNFTTPNEHYKMNRSAIEGENRFETLAEYKARQQGYYDAEIKPLQSKEFQKLKEVLSQ